MKQTFDTPSINRVADAAAAQLAEGNASTALKMTRRILLQGHATIRLLDVDARAARELGELDAALASVEKAINSAGATPERALLCGDLLLRKQRWQAAADVFQKVIRVRDESIDAWLGLGLCCQGAGDPEKAVGCYKKVLELDPDNPEAARRLGEVLLYMGEAPKAAVVLGKLRARYPDSAEIAFRYGDALIKSLRPFDAISVLENHIDDPVWRPGIGRSLVSAWMAIERYDDAMALNRELLAEFPSDIGLLGNYAKQLAAEGEIAKAREVYESILARQPGNYAVWEPYMNVRDEPLSGEMFGRLLDTREVARQRKHHIYLASTHYAAARHFALTGETEKEMEELKEANGLMARLVPVDFEANARHVTEIVSGYTRERMAALEATGMEEELVFILCPPRSGSTLLEQALGRHSAFWPGGERELADAVWRELSGGNGLQNDADGQANLDADIVARFGEKFSRLARQWGRPESLRMVSKTINNYKIAGLLRTAFPRARFVELRRDPVDVALGCYRQNFGSQPFSNTFEGCASEVALFQRTMDWWNAQMPEVTYRLDYEALVEDFEGQMTDLLAWLGEEWEPEVRDFRLQSRVATASVNQVRKGVFREGVKRWKRYEPWLVPLFDAFDKYGVVWSGESDSDGL